MDISVVANASTFHTLLPEPGSPAGAHVLYCNTADPCPAIQLPHTPENDFVFTLIVPEKVENHSADVGLLVLGHPSPPVQESRIGVNELLYGSVVEVVERVISHNRPKFDEPVV